MMNPDQVKSSLNPKSDTPHFSILDFQEIVIIDIETSGLNPNKDEIIEISAVKFSKLRDKETFITFVKPQADIPHYIEYLTNIKPEQLKDAPMLDKVLPRLVSFIGESVIIGHNVKFDLDFISTKLIEYNELPLVNQWWDTCEIGRIYLPYLMNHKLSTLCLHFNIDISQAHRALYDSLATGELFFNLLEYIISYHSITINTRILELCRQSKSDSNIAILLELIVDYQRKYSILGIKKKPSINTLNNIIENKCLRPHIYTQNELFEQNGVLDNSFPKFEFRMGQLHMAEEIERAFLDKNYLIIEAGTGIGKSFAYLIPALQFSYTNSKKIVISTNTKNLQEQLFNKDLPQLKKVVKTSFKAVLVKGRENYICERRWEEFVTEQTRGLTPFEAAAMLNLVIWKLTTITGDITENSSFDRNRFNLIWKRICSDRHYCAGRKCPHFNHCYVMKLRKNVEDANLIIVNHSLLLSDLMSEHVSLGEFEYLIVDEAHNIVQTASRQFGIELSYAELISQLNQLSKIYRKKNIAFLDQIDKALSKSILSPSVKEHIKYVCYNIEQLIEEHKKTVLNLFSAVADYCSGQDTFGKLRIKSIEQLPELFDLLKVIIDFWKDLLKQLQALSNVFSSLNSKQVYSYESLMERIQGIELRAIETENDLITLLNPDLDNYAYWLETGHKIDKNLPSSLICYAPIEVNQHLNNLVYKNIPCVVFTSATMALRNSFKFFMKQSGLDLQVERIIIEKVVESPFDYELQSRLMVAGFLPEPSEKYFVPQALDLIELILQNTPVGTLTLFTSYKDLDSAYHKLNEILYQSNRPLFAQGKWSSRSALLDEFKKHNNAVLLGTSSFWEGIDVQGESLSLLILFKLPFQVPTEPLVEALIEKLDKESKDSFMHYILPNALLRLRQGFGRLIRSKTDKGVVIIIDPRVTTKRYGHYFLEVLPAVVNVMQDPLQMQNSVIDFFKHSHSHYRK